MFTELTFITCCSNPYITLLDELWVAMISVQEKYAYFIESRLYMMEENCPYFTINMQLHYTELILEYEFIYKVCSPLHSLQNEPICKALGQFWLFMYCKYGVFRARGGRNRKWATGGTKRAPILLKFGMWVSFGMHHRWVKGHNATQKFLNFETP